MVTGRNVCQMDPCSIPAAVWLFRFGTRVDVYKRSADGYFRAMPILVLNPRCVRWITDPDLPNREENLRYGKVDRENRVERVALVLTDYWID